MIRNRYFLIFLAVVGVAGFTFWYFQRNAFSKGVLKLEILGPDSADVGQSISYVVKYKNNGDIILTQAKLLFEYPENSLVADNRLRLEQNLSDIYPGQEQSLDLSGRLLGQEGELKKAQAWLSFQPKNLKARYEVSTTQAVQLKFSPLTLDLDLPSRLENEKDFTFSINYFSNVDYPLSQLRLKLEYPADFEFISSGPPALENNEWPLGILNKADGGRISVTGRLRAGVGEQKIFRASLGLWQDGRFILLKEVTKGVEIIKPNIYVSQLVNGSSNYAGQPGELLHYEIFFKNIGDNAFENLFLVVRLTGDFFDLASLRFQKASFQGADQSLVWDWKQNPQLRFLGADEEGKVEFWVNLKDSLLNGQVVKNPVLKDRVDLSPAREEFSVRVGSKLALNQPVFYQDNTFGNSGSLPPRVGQKTTYTVVWQLQNFSNDLKNVKVKAVLPPEVSLTGQLLPREAKFVFDSQSRELVWEAGDLPAPTGAIVPETTLSFQVALMPSPSQRGQAASIIGPAQAVGDDTWIQEPVQGAATGVKSDALSDPGFNPAQGIVY